MKKTYRQKATKRLDGLLREIVRIRDENRCQWCGKSVKGSNSQPSHVIPKARCLHLRWDLLNVKLLCMSCHQKWHLNPVAGAEWFKSAYPARYEYVLAMQHKTTHWKKADYERIEANLKEKLADLKQRRT